MPRVALHIDTGIHRLGLDEEDVLRLREHRDLLEGVDLALIMSHLVIPENPLHPLTKRQRERFCKALETLPSTRTSLASSSGVFLGPLYHFDMVRPGAALYGVNPTPLASQEDNPMTNVATLEARILQIHDVKAGETVGYGADFMVDHPSRIGTVSIGYADGVPRALGNHGHVCAGGRRVPIIGRVSMDLMTIDLSALRPDEVKPGDFVEVIGKHRPIDVIALEAETISYEVLTGLGKRATRVYENSNISLPSSAAGV
jgi:alanine racemase